MKYIDFIGLNDYFQPVYDLTNEDKSYWKQFIPHDEFYTLLEETLSELNSNDKGPFQSIWLQGNYGTGKSHATAVIKHLLYDPLEEIEDYTNSFEHLQLKSRLLNFRKDSRVFPVVLKGMGQITDHRTFALEIEKAFKNTGVSIYTKNDFEKFIGHVKDNRDYTNWEKVIEDPDLRLFVRNKSDLIEKLEKNDAQILTILEKIFSKSGTHFSQESITEWLGQVKKELERRKIANYLMIYWDEFTSILELPNVGVLLNELQSIAELSINKGIYLFLVTHRTPQQANLLSTDLERVQERFNVVQYKMETLTTYHIINAAIKKKDKNKWQEARQNQLKRVNSTLKRITTNEGPKEQQYIENLFPIHPYTAYLLTFIARNIGSTQRSIFKFLNDAEKGFINFINNNPNAKGNIFLTPDFIWDYFYEEFEKSENGRYLSILSQFGLHLDTLKEKGEEYLAVVKGILLLNILYEVAESNDYSLIKPSPDNIKSMFSGTEFESKLEKILTFVDTQQIVTRTPDDLYLASVGVFSSKEIEEEKRNISEESHDIEDLFLYDEHASLLKNNFNFFSNREIEVKVFDASIYERVLKEKLNRVFKNDYSVHVVTFMGTKEEHLTKIREIVDRMSKEENFSNFIFTIIESVLNEQVINKHIDYKARANVASKHSYSEDANSNNEYAKKTLEKWLNEKVLGGYLEWYLQGKSGKSLVRGFGEKINKELSKEIFRYGFENIEACLENKNIWNKSNAKKVVETFISANEREGLEKDTSKAPHSNLRSILKDNNGAYIIDEKLNIIEAVPDSHPLKQISIRIEEAIDSCKTKGSFNLGDELTFLNKPPYGLYSSMINMAAISFLMRKYLNNTLYEIGTGTPINNDLMQSKVLSLFNYWEYNKEYEKLNVRYGSEEEKRLLENLKKIFEIPNIDSLNNVKWKIREWVKNNFSPLWILKISDRAEESVKNAIDEIFNLTFSVDKDLTQDDIVTCFEKVDEAFLDIMLLIKKENLQSLFIRWLKSLENVTMKDEEFDEIKEYLKKNMQEEVASWTEEKVREKVKDWYIEKIKKVSNNIPTGEENIVKPGPKSTYDTEKTKKLIGKVKALDDTEAKNILLEFIEKYNDHADLMNLIEALINERFNK